MASGFMPTGADMVNQATAQGFQELARQKYLEDMAADSQRMNLQTNGLLGGGVQQPPVMNQVQRQAAGDIIRYKQLYELGKAAQDQNIMNEAIKGADNVRQQMAAIGGYMEPYGVGKSLDEAQQALAINDARAVNDLLQDNRTSQDVFQQEYVNNARTGMSERRAMENADLAARQYSQDRRGALDQAFQLYGHSDNVINPLGLQILGRLAPEDEGRANEYLKTFGTPLNEYTLGNRIALANNQQQNMLDRMAAQFDYGQRGADAALLRNKDMAQFNSALSINQAKALSDIKHEAANLSRNDAFAFMYTMGKEAGLAPEQAIMFALQGAGGKSGGSKTTAGGLSAEDTKRMEAIGKRLEAIEKQYGMDTEGLNNDADYQELKQIYNNYLKQANNGGSPNGENLKQSGINFDPNDYDSAMDFMTEGVKIFANGGSDKATKADMEDWWESLGIPREWINQVEWGNEPEKKPTTQTQDKPKETKPAAPKSVVKTTPTVSAKNPYTGQFIQNYGGNARANDIGIAPTITTLEDGTRVMNGVPITGPGGKRLS